MLSPSGSCQWSSFGPHAHFGHHAYRMAGTASGADPRPYETWRSTMCGAAEAVIDHKVPQHAMPLLIFESTRSAFTLAFILAARGTTWSGGTFRLRACV